MIYTVEEVASKLNVSKVTVYNKLKLNQFKDKAVTKQGQTMVDDDLLNLIKDSIKVTTKFSPDDNIDAPGEPQDAQDVITNDDVVNMNKELLSALISQLKEKDIQIKDLHKLLENSQILLKEKPKQDILALEEHFTELDTKLLDIKEKMQERKEQHDKPKGFFKKLFNK